MHAYACIYILGRFAASCGIARTRHAADSGPYDRGIVRIVALVGSMARKCVYMYVCTCVYMYISPSRA